MESHVAAHVLLDPNRRGQQKARFLNGDVRLMTGGPTPLIKLLAFWAQRTVIPICWHDGWSPEGARVASCFALKFPSRLVGVTAAHVFSDFRARRERDPESVIQLHNEKFELEKSLIAINADLDIATFRLDEDCLFRIQHPAFNCGAWPPPKPREGCPVSFAGNAEALFNPSASGRVNSDSLLGGVTTVAGITDRDIRMNYDPAEAKGVAGIPVPPLGESWSGCSGAPVIMPLIESRPEGKLLTFAPVGLIIEGSYNDREGGAARGEAAKYDPIYARLLHFIQPSGEIIEPGANQWLPPQTVVRQ
jgi:hypothetical protein